MPKRVCYVHVGPHKTGTSAIQWFLRENRAELLRRGILVPESGSHRNGAHHHLIRQLCGQQLRSVHESALNDFKRELAHAQSETIILSSEDLDGLLPEFAEKFFDGLHALDLALRIVVFPRNQPQWLNSYYAQSVKSFRTADPFGVYVRQRLRKGDVSYLFWADICATFRAELIAGPFNADNAARGIVSFFLAMLGLDSNGLKDIDVRRNERVGPFTVSCARRIMRATAKGATLTRLQAVRCRHALDDYLTATEQHDDGYCGLTSALAIDLEAACRVDNDAFAKRVWNQSWREAFGRDVGLSFQPNDYALAGVPDRRKQDLRTAISVVGGSVEEILRTPSIAVRAPWNELGSYF